MIEPMMNANAPSTNMSSRIRTAAARFRTRPVIEIAFGVSRDSIRRLRAISRNSPRGPLRALAALLGIAHRANLPPGN